MILLVDGEPLGSERVNVFPTKGYKGLEDEHSRGSF